MATLGEVNRAGKYKNCPLDFGQDGHLEWNDGAISIWANMPMWLFWSIHFTVEGCGVPYKVATEKHDHAALIVPDGCNNVNC